MQGVGHVRRRMADGKDDDVGNNGAPRRQADCPSATPRPDFDRAIAQVADRGTTGSCGTVDLIGHVPAEYQTPRIDPAVR